MNSTKPGWASSLFFCLVIQEAQSTNWTDDVLKTLEFFHAVDNEAFLDHTPLSLKPKSYQDLKEIGLLSYAGDVDS